MDAEVREPHGGIDFVDRRSSGQSHGRRERYALLRALPFHLRRAIARSPWRTISGPNSLHAVNKSWLVCLAALALLLTPSVAEAATVKVYFTRGEQLVAARRTVPDDNVENAIRALLAGPTTAEIKKGYGTTIPKSVTLISAEIDDANVTLNFSSDFATADQTYLARLAQVVYTADAAGMEEIEVRGRTFTRDDFRMPEDYTAPKAPQPKLQKVANTRTIKNQLAALGYLSADAI